MNIWRIHTKSGSVGEKEPERAAQFWIDNKIFGTGWRISKDDEGKLGNLNQINIDEWYQSMLDIININDRELLKRNYNAIKKISHGDLIVIRQKGVYFIGKVIDNSWKYINTEESEKYDTHMIRTVNDFFEIGLVDSIPGKVVNNFRVSKHCNRIANESAIKILKVLYNTASKQSEFEVEKISINNFLELLQPEDLEEVVSLYLQIERNCVLFSSTNKLDTQAYEFVMMSKDDKKRIVAQVKQGGVVVNNDFFSSLLKISAVNKEYREIYIYDAESCRLEKNFIISQNNYCKVIRISKNELISFFILNKELMPARILNIYEFIVD